MEGYHLKPSIGFIGMGHRGSHMAQILLDAGYQLLLMIVRWRRLLSWDN